MNITVKGKKVTVKEEELDIYTVTEFKDTLEALHNDGVKEVVLDLATVQSMSTPAVQVIAAAQKSFKKFSVKNIQSGVEDSLRHLGMEL